MSRVTGHEREHVRPAPHLSGPLHAVVEAALEVFAVVLEERADLRERLWNLIQEAKDPAATTAGAFMSVKEYAHHRRVSERTVRGLLLEMTPGLHFERTGQRGRRVVIRVSDADQWHRERQSRHTGNRRVEDLAVDEVTRLRARVALRKRKDER
jgi:hypothetical protein